MKREVAWRVFAGEYNDSTSVIKGEGGKVPSYVITPLGAKINRLFVVGVLTDVDSLSEGNELIRAHVSDPTGIFTLYSGQFQADVTSTLLNIEVPAFVAFVGKIRTFEPEEGILYLSVRPERVYEVEPEARERWIVETSRRTIERIEAIREGMNLSPPNTYDLRKLGYSRNLSDGVVRAIKFYKNIDIEKYKDMVLEALRYLTPEEAKLPEEDVKETKEDENELENTVMDVIKEIEGEEGALWDEIIERCAQMGLDKVTVEEAISSLLDKGLVYEPVLGTIKTT